MKKKKNFWKKVNKKHIELFMYVIGVNGIIIWTSNFLNWGFGLGINSVLVIFFFWFMFVGNKLLRKYL